MAKLSVRSGRRGRPLSIDPEKELQELIFKDIPKAKERLAEFRKETSGLRDAAILGTETELPNFIQSTLDILADIQENQSIDYESLKQLKKDLRTTRELKSKQSRVYGRALEEKIFEDYESTLLRQNSTASDFVLQSNKRVLSKLEKMTKQQRQKFFFSRNYQDPRTMTNEYKRLVAWASNKVGRQVTVAEAWAILREEKVEEFEE
jgi:hypothetical protein